MGLSFGSLFGNNADLLKKTYFQGTDENFGQVIFDNGTTYNGNIDLETSAFTGTLEEKGFNITYATFNATPGTRNIVLTVTNVTKGTTLVTDTFSILSGTIKYFNHYFPNTDITLGDTVRLTWTGDGIGTLSSGVFGYIHFKINSIYDRESG